MDEILDAYEIVGPPRAEERGRRTAAPPIPTACAATAASAGPALWMDGRMTDPAEDQAPVRPASRPEQIIQARHPCRAVRAGHLPAWRQSR